ncbi:BREX system P-loop protein BrxC [Natronosalvus caseinilyticus]|uniref:BREX system P-loop protein BrxC n=1 Tax=Natronosalvus caseinilyticus TaxID=2953747 RepID=UPI0028ACFB16|nr:BREX system P-loop protein BrxC [Natronosalvus caseinilyticus]
MSSNTITTIEDIFYRKIDRHINRVVKVEQDDTETVKQELDEYVLTGSLEQHYLKILEAIRETEHNPTDETGVWISGFFGSGKSHFMKILGYVLEDKTLPDGRSASDAFKPRAQDETLKATVDAVSRTFDSEVLMFQIGSRTSRAGEDSITDVINREFNRKRGYAELPWVARLEEDLENEGRYEAFKEAVEAEDGRVWEDVRQTAAFVEPKIEQGLIDAVPDFDEQDAKNAITNVKEEPEITPASLAERILNYVDQKERKTDQDVRYFVFLDEISQFIGDDEQMLLELQSIAEEFGQQGMGKLWLGVTSQEKLEELVPGVLAKNLEESKVGDRFPHQTDLISDNLEDVVRDRILQKKGEAIPSIESLYDENEGRLSARYKLHSSRQMESIEEESFVECYPFLPYQLEILPQIFAALRGRGSDDRLTGRERTLIDVTQSVFNEPHNLRNRELGSLATLDLVYEEIVEDIDDDDQRTIANAAPQEVDEELARRVLKSLYLLQRLDWIPNTAANVATTLYDEIGDMSALESQIEEVLEQLVEEGYVGRSEEGYRFLQESERKLEDEIASVNVNEGEIRRRSKEFVRESLDNADTVRYREQAFSLSIEADGEQLSDKGYIHLHAYSPVHQQYEEVDPRTLKTQSFDQGDTIYWIADDTDADDIKSRIKRITQIEQIVSEKRGQQTSSEEQEALDQKKEDLTRMRRSVERDIDAGFQTGTLIYHGTETKLEESGTRLDRIVQDPARDAVERVFTKLDDGLGSVSNRNIEALFGDLEGRSNPAVFKELNVVINGELNSEARIASEVADEIDSREKTGEVPTGKALIEHFEEPPYGWSRDVVRLAAAVLFRNGSIMAIYKEQTFDSYVDDGAQEVFTQISKFRDASFKERETVDPEVRNEAKQTLDILFDKKVKQTDQEVAQGISEVSSEWIEKCKERQTKLEDAFFPLRDEAKRLVTLLEGIRSKGTSAAKINAFLEHKDELEDLVDTVKKIVQFDQSGKLEKYAIYREFLENEWEEFKTLEQTSSFVEISDDVHEAARQLEGEIDSTAIMENWSNVETDYHTIANAYARTYEDLYTKRYELYSRAADDVRALGADLDNDDLETAVEPLTSRMGDASISVDVDGRSHLNLNPSLKQLSEYLQTVDSYRRTARDLVDKLRPKDEDVTHHRVELEEFFGGVVVSEESDLDAPIDRLRTEVLELLEEEGEVEVHFE